MDEGKAMERQGSWIAKRNNIQSCLGKEEGNLSKKQRLWKGRFGRERKIEVGIGMQARLWKDDETGLWRRQLKE